MFTVLAILIPYLMGWSAAIQLREKYLTWNQFRQTDRFMGHVVFGALWPIYLLGWGVWGLVFHGPKKLKELKLPRLSRTKRHEIAPGIPCPEYILVQMAKASLLKDYRVVQDHFKNDKVDLYCYRYSNMNSTSIKLKVGRSKWTESDFNPGLQKELVDFYKSLNAQEREKKIAAAEAESRSKALDGIESLLSIEEG